MVMHHVNVLMVCLKNSIVCLIPADTLPLLILYSGDGSIHGEGFIGHHGFDVEQLSGKLKAGG